MVRIVSFFSHLIRASRDTGSVDDRNIPPLGRVGDPDDILATVLVQDSNVKGSLAILSLLSAHTSVDRFSPKHINPCRPIASAPLMAQRN